MMDMMDTRSLIGTGPRMIHKESEIGIRGIPNPGCKDGRAKASHDQNSEAEPQRVLGRNLPYVICPWSGDRNP